MQSKDIKVGQKWKTRGGQIAHISEVDLNEQYPYRGRVELPVGRIGECWTLTGKRYFSFSGVFDYELYELIEDKANMKHPNYEFVLAFIEGHDVQFRQGKQEDWIDVKALETFDDDFYQCFRIKPSTRVINGFEVPAPLSKEPQNGYEYFYPILTVHEFATSAVYMSAYDKKVVFERGLCFANEEDAVKTAKAMLGINPNIKE